jgi:hypothetical protein
MQPLNTHPAPAPFTAKRKNTNNVRASIALGIPNSSAAKAPANEQKKKVTEATVSPTHSPPHHPDQPS